MSSHTAPPSPSDGIPRETSLSLSTKEETMQKYYLNINTKVYQCFDFFIAAPVCVSSLIIFSGNVYSIWLCTMLMNRNKNAVLRNLYIHLSSSILNSLYERCICFNMIIWLFISDSELILLFKYNTQPKKKTKIKFCTCIFFKYIKKKLKKKYHNANISWCLHTWMW